MKKSLSDEWVLASLTLKTNISARTVVGYLYVKHGVLAQSQSWHGVFAFGRHYEEPSAQAFEIIFHCLTAASEDYKLFISTELVQNLQCRISEIDDLADDNIIELTSIEPDTDRSDKQS